MHAQGDDMSCGLLNIDKRPGWTSRDVVNVVQRLVRPLKVGHAGTLDPLATGVLLVCVGAATRLTQYAHRLPKSYTGAFLLGRHSPTEDVEGQVTELVDPPIPSYDEVIVAAGRLVGPIDQRPPAYSALKLAGRRAYDLARRGETVDLAPRPVTIYSLEVVRYEYPELVLRIQCSTGTYVRSLGRDLAESLGTAAVMSGLVRTAIGPFRVEEAIGLDVLTAENWTEHLQPPRLAVSTLPQCVLAPEDVARIRTGLAVHGDPPSPEAAEIAAFDEQGQLLAILRSRGPGQLGPSINLPHG